MDWISVLISLAALLWLSWRDPKRRRVFGLAPLTPTPPAWPGWALVFIPAVFLLLFGTAAGVVIWMGSVCAFGWMVVAITPDHWRSCRRALDHMGNQFERKIQNWLD